MRQSNTGDASAREQQTHAGVVRTIFSGVIFRESYPNLEDLMRKAYGLYPLYPYFGDYNKVA
jgi:hypothetical protein